MGLYAKVMIVTLLICAVASAAGWFIGSLIFEIVDSPNEGFGYMIKGVSTYVCVIAASIPAAKVSDKFTK